MHLDRLWNAYANVYDSLLRSPLYVELMGQVVMALRLRPKALLLDAGCGTANLGVQIQAIDASDAMLKAAKRKLPLGVHFQQQDLSAPLPYPIAPLTRWP